MARYHWPITIGHFSDDGDVEAITAHTVNGREQVKLLPDLQASLLAAYGALQGQVTEMELTFETSFGKQRFVLRDSRYVNPES